METILAAVADPTRRGLLERLRLEGPLSLGALSNPLPMTRQAVTKHLKTLERSGLVSARQVGRERIHRLEAAPLEAIGSWLEPYEAFWDDRLQRLERHLEEKR
jgi:DNA-binding transcriptional ArsR family regulator